MLRKIKDILNDIFYDPYEVVNEDWKKLVESLEDQEVEEMSMIHEAMHEDI